MKRIVYLFTIFALFFSLSASMISCNAGGAPEENKLYADDNLPDENGKVIYTVTVKTEGGMPLKNVNVAVYDTAEGSYRAFTVTDANGVATMKLKPSASYIAEIYDMPAGYNTEKSYSFNLATANIVLSSSLLDSSSSTNLALGLGSVMYDFTVTTTNNKALKLSSLLTQYDCVLLNFWYINCPFCIAEFPAMDEVAKKYGDNVKIIALNPFDTPGETKDYKDNSGLSFDMVSDRAIASAFGTTAFPTTVIIDRYGVVSFIHSGALTESYFDAILTEFTSENYTQKLYKINDFIAAE